MAGWLVGWDSPDKSGGGQRRAIPVDPETEMGGQWGMGGEWAGMTRSVVSG